MTHRRIVRDGEPTTADNLAAALVAAGLDAESYYSGGGIMVVRVVTRRGPPRPITARGVPTGEMYADPLDFLTIGEPYPDEPFGWDLSLDGEYAEESGTDATVDPQDPASVAAWLHANLARIIAEGRCEDCGNPRGWHLDADQCAAAGIDPGLRDGLGCALYPYVPDRPGITPTPERAYGQPVRANRPATLETES